MKGVIFTFVLTFGGGLVSQFRPFVGLLIYVAFGILRPEDLWAFAIPVFPYSRFVALALLLGWLLHGTGSWQFGRAQAIVLALSGFMIWMTLGAFFHPYPDVGWAQVEASFKVFLPFIVGLTLIDSIAKLKQLAWVIVLCQGYLAYEFNLFYYSGYFDPDQWTFGSLDRNGIAINMSCSVGLTLFLGLHSPRWWMKGLALGLALLMAHVILFSMSRGGMLGLLVTGVVSFLLIRKSVGHYLMLLVVVAAVLRLAGPAVQERFMSTKTADVEDSSAKGRLVQWEAMFRSMADQPVFGIGSHMWIYIGSRQYTGTRLDGHSTWLTVAAEMGVPALVFLAAFYALGVARLWPLTREKRIVSDPWIHYFSRMVVASVIGFAVPAQFVTSYGVELPYYVMLIAAGTLKLQISGAEVPSGFVRQHQEIRAHQEHAYAGA